MSRKTNDEKKRKHDTPEYIQWFELHMKNGDVLDFAEDYDIPIEEGIIGDFKEGRKKFLEYGYLIRSFTIPFDQISYIVTTDVERNSYPDE